MYATLGPNWRVPLRNSPRSRSYVYRYSGVGGVNTSLSNELIFTGEMMCHHLITSLHAAGSQRSPVPLPHKLKLAVCCAKDRMLALTLTLCPF